MEEEDYGHEGKHQILMCVLGSDMEGGMVYQDEDGNLIMYHGDGMGEEDDEMGDEYGMEGSPEVSCLFFLTVFLAARDQLRQQPRLRQHASTRQDEKV